MNVNPFADPPGSRSMARRFRGRLVAPVTIWTAGPPTARAGLTVSSLVIADGDPPIVVGLINDTADLYDAIEGTGAFVVHVADVQHRQFSERFAGLRPSPGGLFAGLEVHDAAHGPVLIDLPVRAYCRLDNVSRAGYHRVITGRIDEADLGEPDSPLVRFRGHYRRLSDRA